MTTDKPKNSNFSPNPNNITIPQKFLDKIVKMQQDQEKVTQESFAILKEHLSQMNKLLDSLVTVSATGSTVAATKKVIPFQTGSQLAGQLVIQPSNPDLYPTQINLYAQNDNKSIEHMTLINDGPGVIFFVVGYSQTDVNTKEGQLNVNDQRELFNVYQIRLRSTLPETTFRLIEGIFRTGSFAPATKANVEIRPTIQANEILKTFGATFDNPVPTITITVPTTQTIPANYILPADLAPLPPGQTAALVDIATGVPMPFTIPEGFIFESFSAFANSSTDGTARNYFELIPGTFSLTTAFPFSNRGIIINGQFNISEFSSQFIDPFGAPPGGRKVLITVTNDDPFNNMIGDFDLRVVLRKLR